MVAAVVFMWAVVLATLLTAIMAFMVCVEFATLAPTCVAFIIVVGGKCWCKDCTKGE